LLQRRGRLTYRALQRQFNLDDAYLADLTAEIIQGQRLAVDEDGVVLVWTGNAASTPAPASAPAPTPLVATPAYLAEKILATRAALEGERKQVTVLFADLKGSTELIAGLDPEVARTLLDPALHIMIEAVHRYEGTVNQVLGDGIMALFGAPLAHEDHAARACYASLAMQAAMRRYAWSKGWCRSAPWDNFQSKGYQSPWRSLSCSGPVRSGGVCRPRRHGD
jgi:Adenylate and Guanylate cyclase catalytic domain